MINRIYFFGLSPKLNCQRKVGSTGINSHTHAHTHNTHRHRKPEYRGILTRITFTSRCEWKRWQHEHPELRSLHPCFLEANITTAKYELNRTSTKAKLKGTCETLVWNLERISGNTWWRIIFLTGKEETQMTLHYFLCSCTKHRWVYSVLKF